MDWKEFVETLSLVDQTLRNDPAGVYGNMDFATRDRYRHSVESLARRTSLTETEVARHAVQLAADGAKPDHNHRRTHVGFYLIDKGLPQLERSLNARVAWRMLGSRSVQRFPLTFYAGGISAFTVAATLWFGWVALQWELSLWKLVCCALVFLVCASQLGVALINWLSALLVTPHRLPRLDFSAGITADCRTMVAVPTMLGDLAGVNRLLETLEIHHLANRDANVHFALLTDLSDAAQETVLADQVLVERAREGIAILNQKYSSKQLDRFFLFHRPRRWNASESGWDTSASGENSPNLTPCCGADRRMVSLK
jgi:hypothetical protein